MLFELRVVDRDSDSKGLYKIAKINPLSEEAIFVLSSMPVSVKIVSPAKLSSKSATQESQNKTS
jgi:hypothetical protein